MSHPLHGRLDDSVSRPILFLDALEEILAAVESAGPDRWMSKRRVFRRLDTDEALFNLRSELAVAATLVQRGVEFDFGEPAGPNPDLVLRSDRFGIEVTGKTPWGLHHLYKALREAVEDTSASIHLRLSEYPVWISEVDARPVVDEAREIALRVPEKKAGGIAYGRVLARTGLGEAQLIHVQAQVLPVPSLMRGAKVTFETDGGELTGLKLAEQRIMDIANDDQKRRQGESMPTLLLVDTTRLGPSWLRPPAVWAERLAAMIPTDFPFSGVGVFISDIGDTAIRNVAIGVAPSADVDARSIVQRLTAQLEVPASS